MNQPTNNAPVAPFGTSDDICPVTGSKPCITGGTPEAEHRHAYRPDISDWWCHDCNTVTDFCQQINPR